MNTKYRCSNSQFNKSKEKGEANKHCAISKRETHKKKWCFTNNILPVTY